MISEGIIDTDAPKEIREFVRDHEHILFTTFIDRGYNGIVYFGKRIKMREDVVVKFYLAKEEFDESEEAVVLRKIDHDYILRVDDIKFLPPYNTYFLSPLISGGDLQNLIDEGNIPSDRALLLIQKLLLGLNELHSKYELVHRDLKPANLLFDAENDNPVIADLGSVKKIANSYGHTSASKCTTLYLPPESIKDNRYTIKSDIYQMGITLYQLLGGYFPLDSPIDFLNSKEEKALNKVKRGFMWNQKLHSSITDKIVKGKLLNYNTLPHYLPGRFKTVLRIACHPDEDKRYNSASSFLIDINKLIRDFPSYSKDGIDILVTHKNLNQYILTPVNDNLFSVSKKLRGKDWRRVKNMDGNLSTTIKSTLKP